MMKKGHQLLAIAGLLLATVLVLSVAYVRHYAWDNKILADNTQIEIETESQMEDTEFVEIENTEAVEVSETEEAGNVVYEFVKSDISYFKDALFIGDSRMIGLKEYGTFENATFFALEGMSIHNLWKKEISVGELGEITLEELLNSHQFGKVYMMLGYNELGYDQTYSANRYKEALDRIYELEPDAIIYICSNLHVAEALSSTSDRYNNVNINNYNEKLKAFADQKTFFYIEVNTPFDDENGNLPIEYTEDKVHLYAKYYRQWCEWFCENTIQK